MANDPSQSLGDFIAAARQRGIADEFIVALLKNAGWSERRIFSAYSQFYAAEIGPVPSRGSRIEYARDAFFYLLAFFSLATWTTALGSIYYRLIDRWIPSPLDSMYTVAYSIREVSWQIAAVVVAFPLFLFVTRLVTIAVVKRPELLDSGVRKWLTNIALVVAAVIVVGDLVTFLAVFLEGDLTSRFVWRVLVVFSLAGGVFAYYLWTLRDSLSMGVQRAFLAAAVAAVFAGVGGGFAQTGSPSHQQLLRLDERRVRALDDIASAIHERRHARENAPLPATLSDLLPSLPDGRTSLVDPVSNVPYEYRRRTGTRYELCATFDNDTRSEATEPPVWRHAKGRSCYPFDARDDVVDPGSGEFIGR